VVGEKPDQISPERPTLHDQVSKEPIAYRERRVILIFHQRLVAGARVSFWAVLLTTVMGACATAPLARPISTLGSVAGRWTGFGGTNASAGSAVTGSGPTELTIRPDGSAEFFLPKVRGGTHIPTTLRLSDGKLLYETDTVTGNITLHEGDGKRVLRGESVRKDGTATSWFEVTQVKP
jgi:hypothetical protein